MCSATFSTFVRRFPRMHLHRRAADYYVGRVLMRPRPAHVRRLNRGLAAILGLPALIVSVPRSLYFRACSIPVPRWLNLLIDWHLVYRQLYPKRATPRRVVAGRVALRALRVPMIAAVVSALVLALSAAMVSSGPDARPTVREVATLARAQSHAARQAVPAHLAARASLTSTSLLAVQEYKQAVQVSNAERRVVLAHGITVGEIMDGIANIPPTSVLLHDVAIYKAQLLAAAAARAQAAKGFTIPATLVAFQACVISREDPNRIPLIMNSSGHFGFYQFSLSTWQKYGGNPAGSRTFAFGSADYAEQTQIFMNAMKTPGGAMNWTPWDGCVYSGPVLTAAVIGGPGAYPLRAISGLVVGRIDEGQDFCGSGPIYAIATGIILHTDSAGWPGTAYIMEKLTSGPRAGSIVYFAESITPTVGVGQSVNTATVIGQMYASSTCIEIGWSTPTPGVALGNPGYVDGHPTAAGYDMEAFLRSL